SELHQDKLISTAVVGDAGKITTPSAISPGTGELRYLRATELDTELLIADAGKVLTQRSDTDAVGEWRRLTPADLGSVLYTQAFDLADIGTLETQYGVASAPVTTLLIRVVLSDAITVADSAITVTVGGATPVVLTVPFAASAAGTIVSSAETTLSAAQ